MDSFIVFCVFVFGAAYGRYLTGNEWAANASTIYRKEWRGRLYKVIHDEEYNP